MVCRQVVRNVLQARSAELFRENPNDEAEPLQEAVILSTRTETKHKNYNFIENCAQAKCI